LFWQNEEVGGQIGKDNREKYKQKAKNCHGSFFQVINDFGFGFFVSHLVKLISLKV
jgi:hypothetical protein